MGGFGSGINNTGIFGSKKKFRNKMRHTHKTWEAFVNLITKIQGIAGMKEKCI